MAVEIAEVIATICGIDRLVYLVGYQAKCDRLRESCWCDNSMYIHENGVNIKRTQFILHNGSSRYACYKYHFMK